LSLIKKNTIAFDKNYKITGETDAVIEMQDSILPVLIKKASGNDYKTVVKQGAFSKDVIELVIYTWLLELKSGILIYDTGNDFHTFHVKKYQPIIESVKKKCLNLIQFQYTNNLPERSYEVRSKECQECEFEKQCWGE